MNVAAARTFLEQAVALEAFTEALFDCHARQHELQPRWSSVREATRAHWRQCVGAAAERAWRSQYSPLAGERLPAAPDPYRVLAMALAQSLGAARSRARTPKGVGRAVRAAGAEAFGAWREAIYTGLLAARFAKGAMADPHEPGGAQVLLEQLPDLMSRP